MVQSVISRVVRRAASLPSLLAYEATNRPPLFHLMERRHAVAVRAMPAAAELRGCEADVIAGLETKGVFVTSLDGLGLGERGGGDIVASGQLVAADMVSRLARATGPSPVMIQAGPGDLMASPLIYQWGLNEVLLRIAAAYLRRPVAYDGPIVFHTPSDGREAGTRRWHLDREDRRMIKVALYLNDVDAEGGPFEILCKESRSPDRPFNYRSWDSEELQIRLKNPDGRFDSNICVGKTGTLVFADTARFYHRGRPATGAPRSAIFWSYFARQPRHPFFCARSRLSRAQILKLAEGLTAEQRACALWRDTLPLMARLIPPSPT